MSEMIKEFNKGDLLHIDKDGKAEWGYPEGYPYKGSSEVVIEWDGNTNGHTFYNLNPMVLCKVSEDTPYNLSGCPITAMRPSFLDGVETFDYTEMILSDKQEGPPGIYFYVADAVDRVYVIFDDNALGYESGIYFVKTVDFEDEDIIYITTKLTYNVETVYPMTSAFLPQATQTTHGAIKKAAAVANVTAAPTAEEFNALLKSLRDAGILATE